MCDSQPKDRQTSIEHDADFLHRGYEIGYLTKRDIERWAEIRIASVDQPAIELIELAMIRQKDPVDILHILDDLRGGKPRDVSVDTQIGLIALCFVDKKHSIRTTINALLNLNYADATSNDQRGEIYLLDHAHDCAIEGRGSVEAVASDLRAFLTPYAQKVRQQYMSIISLHQD